MSETNVPQDQVEESQLILPAGARTPELRVNEEDVTSGTITTDPINQNYSQQIQEFLTEPTSTFEVQTSANLPKSREFSRACRSKSLHNPSTPESFAESSDKKRPLGKKLIVGNSQIRISRSRTKTEDEGEDLHEPENGDKSPRIPIIHTEKLSLITARVARHFQEFKELPRNVRHRTSHVRAHLVKLLDEAKNPARAILKHNMRSSVLLTSAKLYAGRSKIQNFISHPHLPASIHVRFAEPTISSLQNKPRDQEMVIFGKPEKESRRPDFKLTISRTTIAMTRVEDSVQFSYPPLNLATKQTIQALKILHGESYQISSFDSDSENRNPPDGINFVICNNCFRPFEEDDLLSSERIIGDRPCAECGGVSVRDAPARKLPVKTIIHTEIRKHEILWTEGGNLNHGDAAELFINGHSGGVLQIDGSAGAIEGTNDEYGAVIDGQYWLLKSPKEGIHCADCGKGKGECRCYEELVVENCIICCNPKPQCTCWDRSQDTDMFVRDSSGKIVSVLGITAGSAFGNTHLDMIDGVSLRGGFKRAKRNDEQQNETLNSKFPNGRKQN